MEKIKIEKNNVVIPSFHNFYLSYLENMKPRLVDRKFCIYWMNFLCNFSFES